MPINTLYDYYTSKGQALPSVQQRAGIASQAGISNYSGTASQNNQLLSYLQKSGGTSSAPTGGNTLPSTTAPSSAAGITSGISSTGLPVQSPYFGNVSGASASAEGMKTQLDILQKQEQDRVAEANAERDQVLAEQAKNQSLLASLLSSRKSQSEQRSESFASMGIDPSKYFADEKAKIAEIGKLTEEYAKTKATMDGEILQKRDMVGLSSAISKEQSAIERKYAPRLNILSAEVNSKSATLQALQGQFAEAQKFVDQAIEDSTADLKFKLDSFKLFYDMNQDSINRLDSQYKDALNNSINVAEKKYNEELSRKKAVGDAMIKYNSLGANISINDSEDVVTRKIADVGGELAYDKAHHRAVTTPTTTTPNGYKFTATQLNAGANKAGLPKEEFSKLSGDVQNFFISSSPSVVSDAKNAVDLANSGDLNMNDFTSILQSIGMSQEAFDYFKSKVSVSSTPKQSFWTKVKGFFNKPITSI